MAISLPLANPIGIIRCDKCGRDFSNGGNFRNHQIYGFCGPRRRQEQVGAGLVCACPNGTPTLPLPLFATSECARCRRPRFTAERVAYLTARRDGGAT